MPFCRSTAALIFCIGCRSGGVAAGETGTDHGEHDASQLPGPISDAAMPSDDAASPLPDASYAPVVSDPDCQHPEVRASCSQGFCRIEPGCFMMGSPESEWGHPAYAEELRKVTLTRPFEMQQYEVTQREWTALGLPNPSTTRDDGTGDCAAPECPVGNVTWTEAVAYANLLSERHSPPLPPCYALSGCQKELGRGLVCPGFALTAPTPYECTGYRLPIDAEREYAARAGTRTAFYTGDITERETRDCLADPALEPIAWYCHNAGGLTHPVGQRLGNGWGLYDMAGNALEWVNDPYRGLPSDGGNDPAPDLMKTIPGRITRGGLATGPAMYCRAAWQGSTFFGGRGPGLGFRLVRTLAE